jgi:hypothetical protein
MPQSTELEFDGIMCISKIQAIMRAKAEIRIQKLRPPEVNILTYPNGAHVTFGVSSPRVRFFYV